MIKLAILGATGMAGREALLHQQYLDSIGLQYADITCVTASPRNKGNLLGDVVAQKEEALVQAYPFWNSMVCPPKLARLQLDPLDPDLIADKADYVISALDGDLAYDLEPSLRERGVGVFSNASSSRWDPTIPLLIPEVNPEDIAMLTSQGGGVQICNPNCTTAGYTPLIKALEDLGYTLSTVNLVTQQSISGKGDAIAEGEYVKRLLGNVADDWTNEGHNGEEWKSAYEPQRILGRVRSLEDLEIEIIKNKNNEKKIKFEIFNQLKILEKNFTFVAIKSFLKLGNFGRGFHLGGSIPMINDDKINQMKNDDLYSKKNGEIAKYKNVFIIDSTNFTNIPAGSTSLTIMANALRIGAESSND